MTSSEELSTRDLEQLSRAGIPVSEIERQLNLLRNPPPPARLVRPCQPGDGIVQIPADQLQEYEEAWQDLARQRRLVKFVPASGAATRMFKGLEEARTENRELRNGRSGWPGAAQLAEHLPEFAFYDALTSALARKGLIIADLARDRSYQPLLEVLLGRQGLGYRHLPKGLILFHHYPDGPRTSIEEHLVEGTGYLTSPDGICHFHITVAPEHLTVVQELLAKIRGKLERRLEVGLDIELSCQSPSSATIALDSEGQPFRADDGTLVLRPSGHGALLENLQDLTADTAFVKNVDNVAHQRMHELSIRWKRILGGYFHRLQEEIFDLQRALESAPDEAAPVERTLRFIREKLAVEVPEHLTEMGLRRLWEYSMDRLDRPLRVCGMVRNVSEPGGGPFWLPEAAGGLSGQIVEMAQIDLESPDQAQILSSSTHFNPVDLVCGLRTRHGEPWDLNRFVDPATAFVTDKSLGPHRLIALERPGLWNGAMAGWNTAFVEVPRECFTPVKTVFDLLRPEHQP